MSSDQYSMICPHCQRKVKFPEKAIGKTAPCPGCQNPLLITPTENVPPTPLPAMPQMDHPDTSSKPPRRVRSLPIAGAIDVPPPNPPSQLESPPALPAVFDAAPRGPSKALPKSRTPRILALVGGGCAAVVAVLVVAALFIINHAVNAPLQEVLDDDPRNQGVVASAGYRGFDFSTLVFDLKGVSGTNSKADVFRVFLHYAHAMKDEEFESVELAFRGTPKFMMNGSYFQKLGEELDFQNPLYTIRTFPENLQPPDGERAFPVWEGGVLGVLKAQMEDFNEFHDQWYLNDMMER